MNDAIQKELNNDGVLKLSLNRPEVLNAMNANLIMGLTIANKTVVYYIGGGIKQLICNRGKSECFLN